MKRLLAVVLFAVSAFGQDAATVALDKSADLAAALKSADALTRATAGRAALVRNAANLVPQLREALAAEKDPSAAREEMRALVLLGSDEDVAFAASQLRRFPISIDVDFLDMVGRIGEPRATALHLKHAASLRDPSPSVRLSLWGRTGMISGTASRYLAAGNEIAWRAVLAAAVKASIVIDSGVLLAGLNSSSAQIVTDTVWHLAELYAYNPSKLPEVLRERATAPREKASTAEELGREVLRRMLGAKIVERPEFVAFLRTQPARTLVPAAPELRRYLSLGELNALEQDKKRDLPRMAVTSKLSSAVRDPEFRLTVLLPPGLADAILQKTRCHDPWIGVAGATVDRAGRVQSLDLKNVGVASRCKEALTAMLELSLADPAKVTSPFESTNLLMVKPRGRLSCSDELAPANIFTGRGFLPVGGAVEAPIVKRRVEPTFPENVRREMKVSSVQVVAEAVVTRTGCVRDIRLVTQSPWGELNASAVYALAQWEFEPGTYADMPVDVIFNLTINFKVR